MTARTAGKWASDEGFTLLEVMVAVAVLAVGVVPLLVVHTATVANIRRGRELTVAALLARERLAEMEVFGYSALSAESELSGFPGAAAPGDEIPAFLKIEEAVEEIEIGGLLEAEVEALRRLPRSGEEKDPSGVKLATYIVNLYFEPEEDLELEE